MLIVRYNSCSLYIISLCLSLISFTCDQPLWSCEWDTDNDSLFYVGQQNGTVCQFDVRKLASPVQKLNAETTGSPVVSLQYMSKNGAPYDGSRFVARLLTFYGTYIFS